MISLIENIQTQNKKVNNLNLKSKQKYFAVPKAMFRVFNIILVNQNIYIGKHHWKGFIKYNILLPNK